jgi:hypothetical protein
MIDHKEVGEAMPSCEYGPDGKFGRKVVRRVNGRACASRAAVAGSRRQAARHPNSGARYRLWTGLNVCPHQDSNLGPAD